MTGPYFAVIETIPADIEGSGALFSIKNSEAQVDHHIHRKRTSINKVQNFKNWWRRGGRKNLKILPSQQV